tara:strand:+ start:2194 stop:2511 length:318 start_codon:yes stop_codon:yes gene_type:complete
VIKITDKALSKIIEQKKLMKNDSMKLRVAVMRKDDKYHYAMGFDDNITQEDEIVPIDGIDIIVSSVSKPLASGMTIDYVEIEKDNFNFIFLNPNDPSYVEPKEKK